MNPLVLVQTLLLGLVLSLIALGLFAVAMTAVALIIPGFQPSAWAGVALPLSLGMFAVSWVIVKHG